MKKFHFNGWYLFGSICFLSVLLLFFFKKLIPLDTLVYNSLIEKISEERAEALINSNKQWEWVAYVFIPIALLIKFSLVALVLIVGCDFSDFKIKFKRAFGIAMGGELVFVASGIVKLLLLWLNRDSLTLEYVQMFTPLSVINFFHSGEVDSWFLYPLQTANVFEVIYWFVLTYLLSKEVQKPFWKSFAYILCTYVTGLLIWMVFVIFLVLNLSK